MRQGDFSSAITYGELAKKLNLSVGDKAELAAVRAAVLDLRASKGMLLNPDDHDSWSAGSFFTNPIVTQEVADALPADAPRWPLADGRDLLNHRASQLQCIHQR